MKRLVKNIGIFGGTFNPIHFGHLKMAEAARKKFKLDIVYFIPNGNPPHRKKDLLPAKKRYKLVKEAVAKNKYFDVLDIEIKKKGSSYTVDTVKEFNLSINVDKDCKIYFLIVQDAFEKLNTWKKTDELVKMVEFIVFPRGKNKIKIPKIKNLRFHLLKVKPIDISGSEVRKKLTKQ